MQTFKKDLSDLADFALEISGTKNAYTDEDMMNATFVFFEVFSSLMFDHHRDKLDIDQMSLIAVEAGNSISQTIKLFTGVDTKEFFNKDEA